MYGCESWTVKKAERWRIDAFELWCWRRLLRVPWTARRSNQSVLKGISPGISLEGMMLKLKLQSFGHLMRRVDSLEKTDAGRDWGQEEKGTTEDEMAGWHHWLDGRESWWTPGVGDGQGGLVCCDSWGRKESDTTEWLIWSDLIWWPSLCQGVFETWDWFTGSLPKHKHCIGSLHFSPISLMIRHQCTWPIVSSPSQRLYMCLGKEKDNSGNMHLNVCICYSKLWFKMLFFLCHLVPPSIKKSTRF